MVAMGVAVPRRRRRAGFICFALLAACAGLFVMTRSGNKSAAAGLLHAQDGSLEGAMPWLRQAAPAPYVTRMLSLQLATCATVCCEYLLQF